MALQLLILGSLLLLGLTTWQASGDHLAEYDCNNLEKSVVEEIQRYKPITDKIIDAIVNGEYSGLTHKRLEDFCDRFGNRMSGTKNLEDALDFVHAEMARDGLNSYTEKVEVPVWRRGYESAELVKPRHAKIDLLGLGSSVGTLRGGITANVVVVESFKEFATLKQEDVQGKIVVFAQTFTNYKETVEYRFTGAAVAAKKGAVAVLINSVTPFSLGTPHTGQQEYEDGVKKIPTACITKEDAEMLLRMYRKQYPLQIKLEMDDANLPPSKSKNVIGELVGTEKKNTSVVVVSGHLDSWDVGVGAMDDGGGAFISWHAATILHKMGLKPRRTIRAIMWTAEEQGYIGAKAYKEAHKANEKEEFNFLMESDVGTFEPTGLDYSGPPKGLCIMKEIVKLLKPLNATAEVTTPVENASDIELYTDQGTPGASLKNRNENYFWYHHTAADYMIVETKKNLDKATAVFAAAAYVIADLSFDMPK